jgi:hypothetical protein
MMPRTLTALALLMAAPALAQDTRYPPEGEVIPGPG